MSAECRFRDDGVCIQDNSNCSYQLGCQCYLYAPESLGDVAVPVEQEALQKLAVVREKMKEMEWINETCPACQGLKSSENQHTLDCWLKNFIAGD